MGKVLPAPGQKNDRQVGPTSEIEGTISGLPETVRSLTHDLRTPLTALKACLNLILREEAGAVTEDQRHFLSLAGRNIDRLDRMVGDMLATTISVKPKKLLRRRELDLGPILTESVRLHSLIAAEKGLEVDDSGIPASFIAEVDPDLVVRILDNVLGNALKFTPSGGLVRVWLEEGSGAPRGLASRLARRFNLPLATFNLIVDDSGPGLSAAVQSRIFEPFNSGRGSGNRSSGLGLSITRQLAESHGGQVRLASLPGRGTTVWLKLPRNTWSENLQSSVTQLEKALCNHPQGGVRPLVGALDLRDLEIAEEIHLTGLRGFFSGSTGRNKQGWELAPGMWVSSVVDPVNWNRRWAMYAARFGGGLEGSRWEFLGPDRTVARSNEEHTETMVNQAPSVPMIF